MAHVAIYRKYRPQAWKDVVGQDHIVDVLSASVKEKRISHAYLFSGPRGTGKTSVARIFAREIGTTANDLNEMDAASHTSVDDIRALNESVHTLPFDSKYKVYIVDEAHMLSKSAFNALLKTLEEPPDHVVFILATTDLEKVPDTVVSRCQSFVFRKPTERVLADMIIRISREEGVSLKRPSAELIAILSEGSFRDAQSILEKVVSFSKDKSISEDEVEKVTGAPSSTLVNSIINSLHTRDLSAALKALESASAAAVEMQILLKLILHKLRMLLLLRYAKDMEREIKDSLSENDFAFLKELAVKSEKTINSKTLVALLDASSQLAYSPVPELPIEIALVTLLAEDK